MWLPAERFAFGITGIRFIIPQMNCENLIPPDYWPE
jgi:hypothetical protein